MLEHPVDMREFKGMEIAARCRITFSAGVWHVPSQTSSGKYKVVVKPGKNTCDCEDFQLRQQPCKHIYAVRLVQERDHGGKEPGIVGTKEPGIVADKEPKRPTYKQNWPAYNLAQSTEKHRLQELLFNLLREVEEPERPTTKRGPKPHTYRDSLFAMCLKVYVVFSGRRAGCDLLDAHTKGYLSREMPTMKVVSFFDNEALTPILHELIIKSSLPLRVVETVFAPDSTGFSTSRFVRWYDEKYGITRSGKEWVKAHIMCGVKTNVVTAVNIEDKLAGDSPQLPSLLETTAKNFNVKEVPCDKGYLSKENFGVIAGIGASAYIPFKVNSGENEDGLWNRMFHFYQFQRENFLKHYHQRSNVESTFSMVKAKFGDAVRSKNDVAMKNEVLCKFLAHNLCCLIQSQCELGIEPVFWKAEKPETPDNPATLPFAKPS